MSETNLDGRPLMVDNPDIEKRKPKEWAAKYFIKLVGRQHVPNKLMNEYEFAWHYVNNALSFIPISDGINEYDTTSNFNLRANGLVADMYINATLGERNELRKKYIDTSFIRRQLKYV